MVAIRQTHAKSFDFRQWADGLPLPDGEKQKIWQVHDYVADVIKQKEIKHHRQVLKRVGEQIKSLKAQAAALNKPAPENAADAAPAPAPGQDTDPQRDVIDSFAHLSSEPVGILLTLNMDSASLTVAMLYPAFENSYLTKTQVEEQFGPEISKLLLKVRDMEAIRFLQSLSNGHASEDQVDRVRRMLLAMVDDVRAVVIKLAERIAVIRAAKHAPPEVKQLIAKEISNIYAPLANRLGIGQLKWELEDLAFKFLHPDEYMQIARDLGERRVEREQYIADFVAELKSLLEKEGLKNFEVYGRPKHIFSIWRKMMRKHLPFEELYDVRAVRVLVEKIQDCYAVLGIVHARWEHIQKEFDDYIANPKPNGYQSLHTVVYGDGHKVVEIQIRTERMHTMAENGVAAHWKYKEGSGQSSGVEDRINWLRRLLSWRDDLVESGSLLDEFKTQVFEDRVYVFTPQGEVIDLPTGSTPLDFAYAVHTMVGHRCIGAKVDGRIVPYTYKLKTGQQVEIITQKNPNPSRDWLNPELGFLKSPRSRAKVQSWFRKADFENNKAAGMESVEREVSRLNLHLSKDQVLAILKEQLQRFNVKSTDDLYAGVGANDISLQNVMSVLSERVVPVTDADRQEALSKAIAEKSANALARRRKDNSPGGIVVDGVDGLMTRLSHCCRPIPGDKIVGFITQNRGISIHRADCEQLRELAAANPERVTPAHWGEQPKESSGYSVTVRIVGQDYTGFLRDVTTVIANEKMSMMGVRSRVDRAKDLSIVDVDLQVTSVEVFERVLQKIRALDRITSVKRI